MLSKRCPFKEMFMPQSDPDNRNMRMPDECALTANSNVHRIMRNSREVVLVGTSPVSKESSELAERIILDEKPDAVCLELCPSHYAAIREKDRWQNTDIADVIRQRKTLLLLFQMMVISCQKKIIRKFNVNPGDEILGAIEKAEETGADIIPADREIRVTFLRAWREMSISSRMRSVPEMMLSLFFAGRITEKDIEELKKYDMTEMMLHDLPDKRGILIDEREQYLSHVISHAPGGKIVAVVGAGHIPRIIDNMEKEIDMEALNRLPEPSFWSRLCGWLFSAAVIGFFIAAFFYSGSKPSMSLIKWWVLATATFSGAGALIMLAHPATVAAAVIAAPISALHPLIAAGWVAGITEAIVRKPRVRDFLNLTDDISSINGFFRNRLTRILILVAFVNLTTSIGTFVAIPFMLRFF